MFKHIEVAAGQIDLYTPAAKRHTAAFLHFNAGIFNISCFLTHQSDEFVRLHGTVVFERNGNACGTAAAAHGIAFYVGLFGHQRLELCHDLIRFINIKTGFCRDRNADGAFVGHRHQLGIDLSEHNERACKHDNGNGHNNQLMTEGLVKQGAVQAFELVQSAVDSRSLFFHGPELCKKQGNERQRRNQRGCQRKDDRKADVLKELAGHAVHQSNRQENDDGCDR